MSRTGPAPAAAVDAMKDVVADTLYGGTGVYWRLPEAEAELLRSTRIVVDDTPSAEDLALIEAGEKDHLLGLYTSAPGRAPMIQLFANEIAHVGYDPGDVVVHELGHVFSYNHASRVGFVESAGEEVVVCSDCEPRDAAPAWWPEVVAATPQLGSGTAETCPYCRLHKSAAELVGLLDGLRQRAHLQHRIPAGLGGTIPLARRTLDQAQAAAAELPAGEDPEGRKRVDGLLAQTGSALDGWLGPEQVSRAHAVAYRLWDAAYDVAHQHFLHARG